LERRWRAADIGGLTGRRLLALNEHDPGGFHGIPLFWP
jgi:hypothetical protein